MNSREEELNELKKYTEGIENELSMILQSLQWDRKHFLEATVMVQCRHDPNHRVPPDKLEEHEGNCLLKQNGYSKDDKLLPDPPDTELGTLVKLSKDDIAQIINSAAQADPTFKRVYRITVHLQGFGQLDPVYIGKGCGVMEPLSVDRLQSTYTADERRAIHDAVVSAVPSCHDLTDLALLSGDSEKESSKVVLSLMEILAELRNMRRRRTKYRVAAKTRNYSDVLRDVIKTQMEHFNGSQHAIKDTTSERGVDNQIGVKNTNNDRRYSAGTSRDEDQSTHERRETEHRRESRKSDFRGAKADRDDCSQRYYNHRERRPDDSDYNKERRSKIHKEEDRRRERYNMNEDRRGYNDRFRERSYNDELKRDPKHNERHRRSRYEDDYERHAIKQEPKDNEYDNNVNREYYHETSRKRKGYQDDIKQEPVDRGYGDDANKDYVEGSSRKKHRQHEDKNESTDKDKSKRHKKRSKKEHRAEHDDSYRHKKHKHKSGKHHRDRDRESSRDKDYYGHTEKCSERVFIKQEKQD